MDTGDSYRADLARLERIRAGQWVVTCADGQVRHAPFETRAEADHWAWWGHACTAEHTVRKGGDDDDDD